MRADPTSVKATHPAIKAHLTSIACAQAGDKDRWLSLFADDATVHDPVGPSAHDPEGVGFTGKAQLATFWETLIGPSTMTIASHTQIASGPADCACVATTSNRLSDELEIRVDMLVTYRVNEQGLITQLKAYWDSNAVAEQLGA